MAAPATFIPDGAPASFVPDAPATFIPDAGSVQLSNRTPMEKIAGVVRQNIVDPLTQTIPEFAFNEGEQLVTSVLNNIVTVLQNAGNVPVPKLKDKMVEVKNKPYYVFNPLKPTQNIDVEPVFGAPTGFAPVKRPFYAGQSVIPGLREGSGNELQQMEDVENPDAIKTGTKRLLGSLTTPLNLALLLTTGTGGLKSPAVQKALLTLFGLPMARSAVDNTVVALDKNRNLDERKLAGVNAVLNSLLAASVTAHGSKKVKTEPTIKPGETESRPLMQDVPELLKQGVSPNQKKTYRAPVILGEPPPEQASVVTIPGTLPAETTPPIVPASQPLTARSIAEQVAELVGQGQQRQAEVGRAPVQAPGGKISFAAPAEAGGIPSARQAGHEGAIGGATQPKDVITTVEDLLLSKDRVSLQKTRNELSGPKSQAPGIGVARSTNDDLLRLLDARLAELKTGKVDPELEHLRGIIKQPVEQQQTAQAEPTKTTVTAPPPVGVQKQITYPTAEDISSALNEAQAKTVARPISDTVQTSRVGPSGVYFGTETKGTIKATLPKSGPKVRVIEGTENEGTGSGAPVADSVDRGTIKLSPDIQKLLTENDVTDQTWDTDLAGLISLKEQGVDVAHFPDKNNPKQIVSVDLRNFDVQKARKELQDNLLPLGKGDATTFSKRKQNASTIRSNQEVVSEETKQTGQTTLQREGSGETRSDDLQLDETGRSGTSDKGQAPQPSEDVIKNLEARRQQAIASLQQSHEGLLKLKETLASKVGDKRKTSGINKQIDALAKSLDELKQTAIPDSSKNMFYSGAPITPKGVEGVKNKLVEFFKKGEQDKRSGLALSAVRIATSPEEVGFKDVKKPVDARQLHGRISNLLKQRAPAELEVLESAGFKKWMESAPEGKRSPAQVAKWVQDNGPRVEVRTLKAGSGKLQREEIVQAERERNAALHQMETAGFKVSDEGDVAYGQARGPDGSVYVKQGDTLYTYKGDKLTKQTPFEQFEIAPVKRYLEANERYVRFGSQVPGEDTHWSSIAPKPEADMPGYVEIAVVKPVKNERETGGGGRYATVSRDFPDVKFPSSHNFPPNTLVFTRGYMETLPDGKKAFHVIEVQSDWGQRVRADKEAFGDSKDKYGNELGDPLLRDYNRLGLKAAIEHARKEGADRVIVQDAESAMMTEHHDLAMSDEVRYRSNTKPTKEEALADLERQMKEDGYTIYPERVTYQQWGTRGFEAEYRGIAQEKGMRLNYDKILPGIMEELTGSKGERVSLGEHKMAFEQGPSEAVRRQERDPVTGEWKDVPLDKKTLRSNLIFRNPDGTPKTDVSGLAFNLPKADKMQSLFEKDKQTSKSKQNYFFSGAPITPELLDAGKNLAKTGIDLAKKAVTEIPKGVRLYSEPMQERLGRMGGPVSKKVSEEVGQIISHAKKFYGEITDTLDPARKAVGKMSKASSWLREKNEVTPGAAYNNFFGVNEGMVKVPTEYKGTTSLVDTANRDIGNLAIKANPDFKPTGRNQRILNNLGYDLVRRGQGEGWNNLTEGIAKLNGSKVDDVRNFFTKWKAELDAPGIDTTHLDRISQDFVRKFPKTITHVKIAGAWHEVLVADPFNYLEAAAQRTAHAAAFREVYPLVRDPATNKLVPSGYLQNTRKAVMAELATDSAGKEFDNIMRAVQGHPLDVFTRGWAAPDSVFGAAYRMTGSLVGTPMKSLMLTLNAPVNVGEVITGGPAIFLGYKNVVPAMKQLGNDPTTVYKQLESMGAVNRAMYNNAWDPSSPVRSFARIGSNVVRHSTGQQFLNELQEITAAASAKYMADRIRNNDLTPYELDRAKTVFRAMGFNRAQAEQMIKGNDELLNQFTNKSAAWLTAGNQSMGELSRLGASRAFNSLFWFHRYPQMTMNQFRSVLGNWWEDAMIYGKNPTVVNFKPLWHNSALLARQLAGRSLQGAVTIGVIALATSWLPGLKERVQEMQDDPTGFAVNSFLAGLGGPVAILARLSREVKNASSLQENVANLMPPVSLTKDIGEASFGLGKYKGKTADEKLGMFIENKTPGFRAFKTGLAVFGLSQHDVEFETAIRAFYRWRKTQPGYMPGAEAGGTTEEVELREQMKRVRRALESGQDWKSELQKVQNLNYASRALSAGTLLEVNGKPLSEEQLSKLKSHIGEELVHKLQTRDAMLRQVAREITETKDVSKVTAKPTGTYAVDFETSTKRSEHIAGRLPNDVVEFLKKNQVEMPSFTPAFKQGQRKQLLNMDEAQIVEIETAKAYEKLMRTLMMNLNFNRQPPERRREIIGNYLEQARRIGQGKARQQLRKANGAVQ